MLKVSQILFIYFTWTRKMSNEHLSTFRIHLIEGTQM